MSCYRHILNLKYADHVTDTKVKELMGAKKEISWSTELARKKMCYAGHVLRGSRRSLCQLVLEGWVEGNKGWGRPRRKWGDDIKE